MKRGKRQIIERANIFGNDDLSSSNQHPNNPNFPSDNWSSLGFSNTNQQETHVNTNKNQKFTDQTLNKNKNSADKQQNSIVNPISTVSEQKQQTSGDDERKKRLEMLRQKYLKPGQNQETKQQQHKPEHKQIKSQVTPIVKSQQKNSRHEKLIEKKEQIQESKNFFDSLSNQNNNDGMKYKYEAGQKKQNQSFVEQKQESEKPISKPTQTGHSSDHRKTVPLPPPALHDQKRKKAGPPPPINRIQYIPVPSRQVELPLSSSQNINDSVTPSFPSFNNQYQAQKQQIQPQSSNPYQQQQPTVANTKRDTNSFQIQINNWLSNSSTIDKYDNGQSKNQILSELSNNQSVFMREMIEHFILCNSYQFSLQQSAFVQKHLCQFGAISNLTKLFIAIKCGDQTLTKYSRQFDYFNVLLGLMSVKQYLLESEKNRFTRFLLSHFSIQQDYLPTLMQLTPNSPQIYEYLLRNNQPESPIIVAQLLCIMRNNISEQGCPTYLKLINNVLPQIQDGEILESILKLINNISFQSAYQLKKDTKLKIIQKIDRQSGDPRINQPISRQQYPSQHEQRYQRDTDKQKSGSGLSNLMGYVNQTFKKIASQIPDKIQNPSSAPVEEPKETLTYDPILKRWLINGKVPEDQNGQTQTFTPENEEMPKKKVPPPPPSRIKNNPSNKQSPQSYQSHPAVEQTPAKNQPQHEYNPQYQQPEPNRQFRSAPPPPPPRMGLKGMANKKPKLQARYT